jgi:hypothetical protein
MNKKRSSKIITTGFIGAALAAAATILFAVSTTSFVQEAEARWNDGVGAEHASGNSCAELGDRCAFNNDGNGLYPRGGSTVPSSGSTLVCSIDGGGTSSPGREEFNGAECDDQPVAPIP